MRRVLQPLRWSERLSFLEVTVRAVIFANGELVDPQGVQGLLLPDDLIIAANGGAHHALSVGVVPQVIIGDLDSLPSDGRRKVEAAGSRIIAFSHRKDETDLELALRHARREGVTSIIILAALGGRLDHTVANLLLLALPEMAEINVRIVAGPQMAFLIHNGRSEVLVEGRPGDTVSLLPLGGDVMGVTAEGLEWPLHEETLRFGPARGVSNVLVAERARVRVQQGYLLCVVTRRQ
jgi:thiamine pyrophosphokinase